MLISVVIATCDRRDALSACLASVLEQDLAPGRYEVVVVVDGSEDGTREWLASFPSRDRLVVLEQENKGPSAARNAGARAARGEILLFLDDDLICDRHLLSSHLAAHQGDGFRLVFGRTRPASTVRHGGTAARMTGELLDRYYARLDEDPRPKWPDDAWAGPNCSVPRAVFLKSGGYDEERFPRRMEDLDLGLRLWESGLPFRFVPQAVTWHQWIKPDEHCWRDTERDGAGTVAICRKHPEYRVHASLPGLAGAPRWKRWVARQMAAHRAAVRFGVGALLRSVEVFPNGKWTGRVTSRLFGIRQTAALLAGAYREAGSWRALEQLFGRRLAVLLYHHVGTPPPQGTDPSLTISPESFERHLGWLRSRGYTSITTAQWLAWRSGGIPLPDKAVMLTFDDGYADFASHALPALERNGFTAVQFVITGLLGGAATWEGLPVISGEEIRDCRNRGIEIGGHSRRHPNLTAVSTAELDEEVCGAKRDLQALGISPVSFAYPFGFHDERVRASVEREFKIAFTCDEGVNDLRTDRLSLRRTMVQPGDTRLDIELRAAMGWSPFTGLRTFLRPRSRVRGAWRRVSRMLGIRRQPA